MLHKDYQVIKKIVLFGGVENYEKSIVFFRIGMYDFMQLL